MYAKILKKDLKRKKSMNFILLIFVVIAAMFVVSGVQNLLVVTSGTDYYMEQANLRDYYIITSQNYADPYSNDNSIRDYLDHEELVKSYTEDDMVMLGQNNFKLDGERIPLDGSIMASNITACNQVFFDEKDKKITSIKDGEIYLPYSFMLSIDAKPGQILEIYSQAGYSKDFVIAGYMKDALLGSEMMGTNRLILSDNDFQELISLSNEHELVKGKVFAVDTVDLDAFSKQYSKHDFKTLFNGDRNLVKATYILDMVTAAMILIVSICLLLIAAVMLRFLILFTVNEDYKEIGIMKAVGIKDSFIRRIYMTKYFAISVVGAFFGLLLSFPFSNLLLKNVSCSMVLQTGSSDIVIPILLSVLVVIIVSLCAYVSTRRIKKLTPMDAIRSGNNGERFKRKGLLSLSRSHVRPTTFLAANDVINELKKYLALFFAGVIGLWLIAIPANTVNTLGSDHVCRWFGTQESDIWLIDDVGLTRCILQADKQVVYDYLDEIEANLKNAGVEVEKPFMEIMFSFRLRKGDNSVRSFSIQGLNVNMEDYLYTKGSAPRYDNEVALTESTAKNLDASIGDTIYVSMYGEERPFVVTALYQSMNNLGEGIRFNESADIDYTAMSGTFAVQLRINGVTADNLQEYKDKIQAVYPDMVVQNTHEFIIATIGGIFDRLGSIKMMVLMVVACIIVLVVVLMQKMFLIREAGQIGMLKSVGFTNGSLVAWQTKRVGIVLILGMLTGAATGGFMTRISAGQVFKFMGAPSIEFVIRPLENYVLYPMCIFVIVMIACILTMSKIRKITPQNMNENE